ncbi:hypothetical protein ColTof4_00679 [Colletotrichum tofieldiae]|uniref:Uncharacterized protein n=1 Tax=Colletotrichum tofieldiae TaxID=708197 RepID=A0A166XVH5_9PEZI|nr:hypothetical protein CT0861_07315 [Colletotrichum tofieldiae]GKT60551.1 hypothetical protein ColTof3_07890 [Colletotrichum tofieldiae]GKT68256.1 hypothetical protein ColTof4_00679 [Colletotrichum tofieldiae]GKT90737.1 hypothetical protein Ct61P_08587 [Colletotrichum tofieldiae]
MHFPKTLLSAVTLALSTTGITNPVAQPGVEKQQQQHKDRELSIEFMRRAFLEDRQGWTCGFLGGEKDCQVKLRMSVTTG